MTITKYTLPLLMGLSLLFSLSVHAAETQTIPRISVPITAEGWVTTQTARVTVAFDTVPNADNPTATRERILEALDDLDRDAEWQIIGFRQRQDQTGLTQWRVLAETRVPGDVLTDLPGRSQRASQPGFRVTIAGIDYTPSQAERTAAERAVRLDVYAAAEQERQALMQSYEGSDWRILVVDFTGGMVTAQPVMRAMQLEASSADASFTQAGGGSGRGAALPVAQRLTQHAIVVLERRD